MIKKLFKKSQFCGDTLLTKRKNGNGFFITTKDGKTIKDFTVKDLWTLLRRAGYRLPSLTKQDYENESSKNWLWQTCVEKNLL